ncbi:hypothetical protein CES87_02930 [Pseudomonas sp. ERMR1:02]|nr:hypothetical protein CES87_02930 [Pseudomonas sp. ERMR1:02]
MDSSLNLSVGQGWNAERPERHSHAERGNDQVAAGNADALEDESAVAVGNVSAKAQVATNDRSHALRGNAARDALRHSGVRLVISGEAGTRSVP